MKTEIELATSTKLKLAAKILNLIADKGWSKKEFADKVGKQNSVISRWISGDHNYTIDTLTEIAHCFGIEVTELLNDKEPDWKPLAY